jgi:hypothetical protein
MIDIQFAMFRTGPYERSGGREPSDVIVLRFLTVPPCACDSIIWQSSLGELIEPLWAIFFEVSILRRNLRYNQSRNSSFRFR